MAIFTCFQVISDLRSALIPRAEIKTFSADVGEGRAQPDASRTKPPGGLYQSLTAFIFESAASRDQRISTGC